MSGQVTRHRWDLSLPRGGDPQHQLGTSSVSLLNQPRLQLCKV